MTLTWDNQGYEIKHIKILTEKFGGILYLYNGTKRSGTKILKLKIKKI